YQVAVRVARAARARRHRRQRHEEAAAALSRPETAPEPTWQEIAGILDEELVRLPEKYRAVLVLCCLEGKARDEAAEAIGLTSRPVKKRLEQGRNLLRQRLARRGLTLSVPLLASLLAEGQAAAAVPTLLLVTVTRAAIEFAAGQSAAIPSPILSLV